MVKSRSYLAHLILLFLSMALFSQVNPRDTNRAASLLQKQSDASAQPTVNPHDVTALSNTFVQPQAAKCMNGRCNEALYPGTTLGQRLANACNQYSGKVGIVQIPVTESDTTFAPSSMQEGCIIEDERGIVIPSNGGFGTSTGTNSPRGLFYYQQRNTATSTCCTNPSVLTIYQEANAGGFNNWNGSTGTKTNYIPFNTNLLARTVGQHIGQSNSVMNYSGSGDVVNQSWLLNDIGAAAIPGDEADELISAVANIGLPAATFTVSSIRVNGLTLACGTNCNQLGEQNPLLITSRNVYSAGKASISERPGDYGHRYIVVLAMSRGSDAL